MTTTTFEREAFVHMHLTDLAMRQADLDYILGAFVERQMSAHARGEYYEMPDFLREALIEASHR